ncbi:SH2 domain-containing protein 2A [Diceros bicornis minor]|uniref:SH2 domain-containing protein 2A n=1 Tax=Diceros bicornis minor TaxID=77932 RepID=UPI0026EDCDC4|nr:SH2 domain-containing protein 2A [Diceros bicornis minor]XP_058395474.1 SH2 domain-containing protein 2A [Diceros bicornis minor]
MEFPLAQICPQGNRETPAPTFSTFQPMNLTGRSCQGLGSLPGPRLQALKAEEAQPSPRALAVHIVASPQALGAASNPENTGKDEEVPREGGQSLQAETRAWFQKTQAHWLLQHGAAPAWFHGFITRREAEKLLQTKPLGCYLVRFSESAVTFVLTYRSRTCCRHFLLAQLADGRHVVLGEDSAHARLQDLLRHYTACPLSPYGETLTEPLARQTPEPAGLSLRTEESDSGNKSQDPHPQYSPILKKEQTAASTQKEGAAQPKEPSQPPRPKPRVTAKPQLPPEVYTIPAPRPRPAPPPKPSNPIYQEPDEPIDFYAMGRGSPGEATSNIYAEVEVGVPAGEEGPPSVLQHLVLRKCRSKPVPGSQNLGGRQLHSENSVAGQGPPMPHQPLPRWGNTLPNNLSRQVLQDRGQPWLPLGPPQ